MQWAIGFALNNLALAAYYNNDLAGGKTPEQVAACIAAGLERSAA